jgi:DNA-binding MarR family transcriptional regulator
MSCFRLERYFRTTVFWNGIEPRMSSPMLSPRDLRETFPPDASVAVVEASLVSTAERRARWIPSPAMDEAGPEPPTDQLPVLDEMEQRCWQVFLESSTRLLEMLERRLVDAHRLTMFEFLLLDLLARSNGGSARMGDLAQELAVGPSRVTQQIRRLEAEGLVRRSRSANDGRGVIASITREGRARVKPAVQTYARAVRRHYLDLMSRQQMIAMGDSCRRISHPLKVSRDPETFKP